MLVDSHCHLDFPDFGDDIEGVLARAAEAGVGTLQTICTRVTQFDVVRGLAEAHAPIWCSVGIHPHHVAEEPEVSGRPPGAHGRASKGHRDRRNRAGLSTMTTARGRQQDASFRQHIAAARENRAAADRAHALCGRGHLPNSARGGGEGGLPRRHPLLQRRSARWRRRRWTSDFTFRSRAS